MLGAINDSEITIVKYIADNKYEHMELLRGVEMAFVQMEHL